MKDHLFPVSGKAGYVINKNNYNAALALHRPGAFLKSKNNKQMQSGALFEDGSFSQKYSCHETAILWKVFCENIHPIILNFRMCPLIQNDYPPSFMGFFFFNTQGIGDSYAYNSSVLFRQLKMILNQHCLRKLNYGVTTLE